ncbi:ATP-binding protein [Streptomyces sp. HUCO-GS316]|uniref:sensor histidine kinase n=1 Tax=Streptomyces sp. HUCO-GS316 TaxID=2692198 RepID=UPI0013682E8C|nr:ATP-binding protein [Streptomyces sp. HUCO-GS316]MXM64573.1 ATP-binding protein [Streptomyces sp. HUCO-GS316]
MSHLRAPAARADRREGGRHGRPPAARTAPVLPEAHIRPQLLRLAVLPPVAVSLSACAAVLFTVRSTGARPGLTLWGVLAGAVSVALAGILIAAVAANRTAASIGDRIGALRRSSARGEADLRALVEALRRGEGPPQRKPRSGPPEDADDFELLAADLARAHDGAITAVVRAAQLSSQTGSEQKLEVFLNLARRLQSLVHREISILDELENEMEDPDLLKGLFHVDHLATRIRRHAENLAVLGGAVSRRQWSNPVDMTEVLRSAIAEVEQYSRVKLVPPVDGTLRGHAVADVIHLLAELVENATVFSAPHTQVLLRASLVTSGLAVEVEDRGLGMPVAEQNRMNALLADPDQVNVASLLADGRIGLFVVSQLAKRHGIHVRLQSNIYGGVQAVLVVPQALLGTAPGAAGAVAGPSGQEAPGPAVPQGQAHGHERDVPGASGAVSVPSGPSVPPPRQHPQPGQEAGQRIPSARPAADPRPQQQETTASGARRPRPEPREAAAPTTDGSGPAPLPRRGAHDERPNPADAMPGIRPDERRIVVENSSAPPTPRGGAVRGTMGKPQLPRRRAQEHLVPQLRGGPTPRQDQETPAGHDPGLMAAFQRGVGLAEAQQHLEPEPTPPTAPTTPTSTTLPSALEALRADATQMTRLRSPMDTSPVAPRGTEARGARDGGSAAALSRFEHTTRQDGSAPAG